MDTEKTFKTKTGYCHILPDKIVLTRNGIIGNIAQVTVGNSIVKPLISYGLISLGELYLIFISYKNDMYYVAGMLFLLWVLLIIQIIKSLNNSGTPIIKRDKIVNITFKKAIPGATRAYFIVRFENDKGKIKQRLIMLPGTMHQGTTESQKAFELMASEFKTLLDTY